MTTHTLCARPYGRALFVREVKEFSEFSEFSKLTLKQP